MNTVVWVLQILLAIHTAVGAIWKFSNSEQTVPALSAIPHGVWLAMAIIELLCSLALILPAMVKSLTNLAPIAAAVIAAEMLVFCGLQFFSSLVAYNQVFYWLAVAAVCAFIIYGHVVLRPQHLPAQ